MQKTLLEMSLTTFHLLREEDEEEDNVVHLPTSQIGPGKRGPMLIDMIKDMMSGTKACSFAGTDNPTKLKSKLSRSRNNYKVPLKHNLPDDVKLHYWSHGNYDDDNHGEYNAENNVLRYNFDRTADIPWHVQQHLELARQKYKQAQIAIGNQRHAEFFAAGNTYEKSPWMEKEHDKTSFRPEGTPVGPHHVLRYMTPEGRAAWDNFAAEQHAKFLETARDIHENHLGNAVDGSYVAIHDARHPSNDEGDGWDTTKVKFRYTLSSNVSDSYVAPATGKAALPRLSDEINSVTDSLKMNRALFHWVDKTKTGYRIKSEGADLLTPEEFNIYKGAIERKFPGLVLKARQDAPTGMIGHRLAPANSTVHRIFFHPDIKNTHRMS